MHKSLQSILLVSLLLAIAGCATTGEKLGPSVGRSTLPAGAPAPEAILADLAKNDAAIQGFKASGKFILKSPQLEETLLLPQSSITFRRPADLSVSGRKLGTPVGRLTCAGESFLLEDAIGRLYLLGERGARFQGVSREVSPADIARETFLPEDWGALRAWAWRRRDAAPTAPFSAAAASQVTSYSLTSTESPSKSVTVMESGVISTAWSWPSSTA